MIFPDMLDRFIRYVKIDTQSAENSKSFPSTQKQFNLARLLKTELEELGLLEVNLNKYCYLTATLKSNWTHNSPTIALFAHLDTSPDVSGSNVSPIIHHDYTGKDIILSKERGLSIKVKDNLYLKEKIGKTIITSGGNTLLGADDKAGIAEIMSVLKYLIDHDKVKRPDIRVIFTPDEEIGQGTRHISLGDISADYGYTIDGGKIGSIEDETFCADSALIEIGGINVHPGYAKNKMINAVKIASEIITALPKDTLSPETTDQREGFIHPYSITGGVEKTLLKLIIRDFSLKGLNDKKTLLKKITDNCGLMFPQATIKLTTTESYRNMKVVLNEYPLAVSKAVRAIKRSGLSPVNTPVRGGTDGAKISFMGLPTPNLFTGGINFHSKQEWIALEDMHKAAEVIVNLLQLWLEQ